ncbi:sensor histidine kinase [Marinilabilia salmonicolor]|uniref:sensor histidine kinase n=1 Tax=Marinilabilia salmonicolor TaxID=989 RepID=UPI00029A2954|nr:histidine kinase [Marinilabilia salmonicolor]
MIKNEPNTSGDLRKRILKQILFWTFAAALLFLIFSNREYDLYIRLVLVALVSLIGFSSSILVNQVLIPRYLFRKKQFRFYYLLTSVFLVSLWIILVTVVIILLFSMNYLPEAVIPDRKDVTILLTGNYLMVILAGVIHFIQESYQQQLEKKQLEQIKREMELKLREARLKLMQDQIHPHFIFNMLNNLYGLVSEDSVLSRRIILKLSGLLEYMLYECDESLLPLQKELTFIQNYIELERIRHEVFDVTVNFPEKTEDLEIAPLVLFPFVENAFKHGLSNTLGSFIHISLTMDDGTIHFLVKNSNIRIHEEPAISGKHGIGLKNIQERLLLIYGDKYDLQITDEGETYQISLKIRIT